MHRPEHGHPRLVLADQAGLGWWTERNIYSLVTSSAKLFSYQTEKPPAGLLHNTNSLKTGCGKQEFSGLGYLPKCRYIDIASHLA